MLTSGFIPPVVRGSLTSRANSWTEQQTFADGSASAPSIAFESESNTGMYLAASNTIAFAVNGNSNRLRIRTSDILVGVDMTPAVNDSTDLGNSTVPRQWRNLFLSGYIQAPGLPTSDPNVAGRFWNNSGVVNVSSGP